MKTITLNFTKLPSSSLRELNHTRKFIRVKQTDDTNIVGEKRFTTKSLLLMNSYVPI